MTPLEDAVVDVAIVGAGLCGLALARTLAARGVPFALVDARERLGGRMLSRRCETSGQMLDLGPTWFWPDTEPRIAALVAELGLSSVAQHDPGDALWLTDPNREPERRDEPGGVHAGARRIAGGIAHLVDALAAGLPADCVMLGSALRVVRDRGAWIELRFDAAAGSRVLRARKIVLALPPRLVRERLVFDPPLPDGLAGALEATPTWMAAEAKALTTYATPFWRTAGHSGNAFVRHPQAALGEVFDASDPDMSAGALGGFVALDAAQRVQFAKGMTLLVESQLAQLYGRDAQDGTLHLFDWAAEPWTCSDADWAERGAAPQADPALRRTWWSGRLHFGGSETAAHGAGHMEGALEAAARIARLLAPPVQDKGGANIEPATREDALARFKQVAAVCRADAPEHYRRHVTRLLSGQRVEQLTQHALLATVEQVYSHALVALDALLPSLCAVDAGAPEAGRHPLTRVLLAAFDGWNRELIDAALAFNGTSCALSNFPDEHRPDEALQRAIAADLAAAWREFALELNARLLESDAHVHGGAPA
ncbi:FAD-dependent oxidoreductase [Trinickia caryophylli]|uniref:Monoamine oxidase n=1 Tax=Trinickia caryophylli TaxID=28094 RepID=A0A1X7EF01_TRICW|nr:FAD-dependent oxidoreductase [Trinickia caryophylli]PMS11123.1 amine oxidase [Trinickia caryophylli]TRX14578.1 FAD-dependent oxidoreductase [Trinickia caryophylli]WQE14418.1 FAD-dependent oxidoreductase [Trinickia caryophylli]SMF32768.1 monoamine oxidase [Trinickia caryophylli]GLU32182.1 hypothetical protein Busp01_20240 [Trinickia caryophylli]